MGIIPLGRRVRRLRPVLRHRHALYLTRAVRHHPVWLPLHLYPTMHWLLPHVLRVHRRKKCLRMRWGVFMKWKEQRQRKKHIKCKDDIWSVLLFSAGWADGAQSEISTTKEYETCWPAAARAAVTTAPQATTASVATAATASDFAAVTTGIFAAAPAAAQAGGWRCC